MKELPEKAHYRPDEVADYFDIPSSTLYQWIQEGKVKALKIAGQRVLRIEKDEVERMKVEAIT
jgi:excisionase family DNA binding protein